MAGESDVMKTTVESINSRKAEAYLATACRNRRIKHGRVSQYRDQMLRGLWRLTHQGIAFNVDGQLFDGQNRLHAVLGTDLIIPMSVTRNVPSSAMLVADRGCTRTDADAMEIEGLMSSTIAIATAHRMMNGTRTDGNSGRMCLSDLRDFLEDHEEALEFATSGSGPRGAMKAAVRAVIARAYDCDENLPRLQEFKDAMITGRISNPDEDGAAITLRNFLQRVGKVTVMEMHRKAEASLRAFLDRRDLKKVYESPEELFPAPGCYKTPTEIAEWP